MYELSDLAHEAARNLGRVWLAEQGERIALEAAYRIEEMRQDLEDRHERMLARIADLVDGIDSGRYGGMTPDDISHHLVSVALDEPDFADAIADDGEPVGEHRLVRRAEPEPEQALRRVRELADAYARSMPGTFAGQLLEDLRAAARAAGLT